MGFRSYERINLKDHKKRAEAAKTYKEKLSTLRISLRSYRKSPPTPTTPPALPPTIATNTPPPVGGDTPRTPTIQPRPWLGIPNDIPTNSPPAIAIGMPAPQPRQLD